MASPADRPALAIRRLASRWFLDQERRAVLLQLIDDPSRLLPGARLYERASLLAHLDLLSGAFLSYGLPLALYVDYHSFFFTSQSEAFTQLGATLRFYDISLRFAPTPQAKGKIERAHDFWQKRLPPLFAAEHIATLSEANALLQELRLHHNHHEKSRVAFHSPRRLGTGAPGKTLRFTTHSQVPLVALRF